MEPLSQYWTQYIVTLPSIRATIIILGIECIVSLPRLKATDTVLDTECIVSSPRLGATVTELGTMYSFISKDALWLAISYKKPFHESLIMGLIVQLAPSLGDDNLYFMLLPIWHLALSLADETIHSESSPVKVAPSLSNETIHSLSCTVKVAPSLGGETIHSVSSTV